MNCTEGYVKLLYSSNFSFHIYEHYVLLNNTTGGAHTFKVHHLSSESLEDSKYKTSHELSF